MSILQTVFKNVLARQVAQHGSVAAMAIGLIASLAGVPLAPEQVNVVVSALAVVVYLVSQVKALWHKPAVAPVAAIVVLALLSMPTPAPAADVSPDLSAISVDDSINHGKTLVTAQGTWSFGPNIGPGGNEILINGNGSNGGNATFIQVGDTGKMFAHAADNSWWLYDPATTWHTSAGTPYVVTCTPPTTYLSGATINLHLTYTFTRGTSPKDFATEVNVEQQCSHTYFGLQGNQYISVTAKDPTGSESALSNQVAIGVFAAAPQAPTNLVVKGNAQVFAVKQSKDHLAATVPVGTIPLGTACNTTERVNDMFVVPRDQVTWYGNVKPQAVVAACNVP